MAADMPLRQLNRTGADMPLRQLNRTGADMPLRQLNRTGADMPLPNTTKTARSGAAVSELTMRNAQLSSMTAATLIKPPAYRAAKPTLCMQLAIQSPSQFSTAVDCPRK